MTGTLLAATAGQGVMRSCDDGASWFRTPLDQDLEYDATVRCLTVHPAEPATVLAGADVGLVRSDDCGVTWSRVDAPFDGDQVWSLAVDPVDPDFLLLGTGSPSPARVWRSTDAGRSWELLSPVLPRYCAGVGRPRVTTCAIDPNGTDVWFGVEEGGLWRSRDRGDTWQRLDAAPDTTPGTRARGVDHSDIHVVTVAGDEPRTLVVVTVGAVWTSTDDGASWEPTVASARFGLRYARSATLLADGSALLVGVGDGTPGTVGRIHRSPDRGRTWHESVLDGEPNSTFWTFGTHPSDPALVLAGTKYGHLYRSRDAGVTWAKEPREFSELTGVAWTPAVASASSAYWAPDDRGPA